MKRTVTFVRSRGTVRCTLPKGPEIRVPVVPGILKHPTVEQLRKMLKDPDVVRKYTIAALREAPWSVLREFPTDWLKRCLPDAHLNTRRAEAVAFLLG